MTELKGFEEAKGATRPKGVEHGASQDRKSWLERKTQEEADLGYKTQPYCVIVGGGQGGIALGARLKRLGVPTIVLEKNPRAGDSWRNRYRSLCLHDPVWYDHLPYLPFPEHWPVFAPKDKIGDWLEMYTKVMELNYWTLSEATSATYDEAKQEWTVSVNRNGETVVLRPKQLVLATGMSGIANVPKIPGAESFKGDIHHSSKHPGGEKYRGKKCVVIGSNNSAHDICADLWEHGADVTMLQRSSTHIARSDTLMELALGGLYSEEAVKSGVTTNTADMIFASIPYKIMHTFQIPVYQEMARRDADFYARLKKAGFMLDFGEDGSGLFMKYLRRGSGYYIDVGASELVADGRIKLKSGVEIERITRQLGGHEGRHRTAGRTDRLCHRLRFDERLGRQAHQPAGGRQGGQVLGPGFGHGQGPGAVGRRGAQHVEAHAAAGAVVPRRQPAPEPPLLAIPVAATEGALRRAGHTGVRAAAGAPSLLKARTVGFDQSAASSPLMTMLAWISAAPSNTLRMRASQSTRLMRYSSA